MHAGDLHARHAAHIHQTSLRQQLPRHTDVHDGRRRLAAQGQRMPGDKRRQFVQTKMQPADLKDHRQFQCPDRCGGHRGGFCGGPIALDGPGRGQLFLTHAVLAFFLCRLPAGITHIRPQHGQDPFPKPAGQCPALRQAQTRASIAEDALKKEEARSAQLQAALASKSPMESAVKELEALLQKEKEAGAELARKLAEAQLAQQQAMQQGLMAQQMMMQGGMYTGAGVAQPPMPQMYGEMPGYGMHPPAPGTTPYGPRMGYGM